MEQESDTTVLFTQRYELVGQAGEQGDVTVIDREPWQRCWSCHSTDNFPGEAFCTNCGAALEKRSYAAYLTDSATPEGPALVTQVAAESFARRVLPPVWDTVESDGRLLVVFHDEGFHSVDPPLDELQALRIGYDLTGLLGELHDHNLFLGQIAPEHITLTSGSTPRLLQVPHLHRLPDTDPLTFQQQQLEDVKALGELLEALTATPRTTQRLAENELMETHPLAEELEQEQAFSTLLRDVRTGTFFEPSLLEERFHTLIQDRTRPRPLRQVVGAASNTGVVRDHNEDSCLYLSFALNNTSQDFTRGIYIVADGMGGHAAGEVASRLAVQHAAEVIMQDYLLASLEPGTPYDARRARATLTRAVLRANEAIRSEGMARGNDMGTTITMAMVIGDRATIANVGDSRTYLYRNGKLQRISRDHSLVMRLVELGQLSENDIYTHPQRNAVLRSLGDQLDVEVDLFSERLQPGDMLLLCSDGQWEMTHDPEMEHVINQGDDPQKTVSALIGAANQRGGEDNITAILVRLEEI